MPKRNYFLLRFALACVLSVILVIAISPNQQSVFAACLIQGTVFRDYNADGVFDVAEPGVPNITVNAYDAANVLVATAVTGPPGTYTLDLSAIPDQEVRVEFDNIPTYLRPGPSTPLATGGNVGLRTTVTFVTCDTGAGVPVAPNVNLGLANPGQFCQTGSPELTTNCYVFGDNLAGPNSASDVLVSFPYTATGLNPALETPEAIASQIGSTFGLAYHRGGVILAAAFMKRHSGFGPNGTGAIYSIYRTAGGNQIGLFIDMNTIGGTGADPHPPTQAGYDRDLNSFDAVGKMSLGDIDISDDNRFLYVMNLLNRTLYEIPIVYNPTATPPISPNLGGIRAYPVPSPACTNGQFRPFATHYYDGIVYVGGVCSAESPGGTPANLTGHILRMTPGAGFAGAPILSFPLNYPRGCAYRGPVVGCTLAPWNPWTATWQAIPSHNPGFFALEYIYPQPIITDLVIDETGMTIGIRDRYGDQTGYRQNNTILADNALYTGDTAGDTLRACQNAAGNWVLESNASCDGQPAGGTGGVDTGHGPGPGPGPAIGFGEFYFQESFPYHDETSLGGLTYVYGRGEVVETVYDPLNNAAQDFQAGTLWMSTTNGARTRPDGYSLFDTGDGGPPLNGTFGKGGGLGDLEAMCGPAPLEIGNRVWEDLDRNGQQDPGEVDFGGVTLSLYIDTDGNPATPPDTLVGRTTTNAEGEYIFNANTIQAYLTANGIAPVPNLHFIDIDRDGLPNVPEPFGVLPERTYQIRIEGGQNNFDAAGDVLFDYYATPRNTVVTDIDSNGGVPNFNAVVDPTNEPISEVFTMGTFGENDHTFDFGFALLPSAPPPVPPGPGGGGAGGTAPTPGPQVSPIQKTVNKSFVVVGDTLIWTITVTNFNAAPTDFGTVSDTLPAQLTFVSLTHSGGGQPTRNGQTVNWPVGIIAPGQTVTLTIVTRLGAGGSGACRPGGPTFVTNEACLTSGLCSEISVFCEPSQLPATGEARHAPWRTPAFAAVLAVMIGLFTQHKRLIRSFR